MVNALHYDNEMTLTFDKISKKKQALELKEGVEIKELRVLTYFYAFVIIYVASLPPNLMVI